MEPVSACIENDPFGTEKTVPEALKLGTDVKIGIGDRRSQAIAM
jgi:hypothetical protein